MHFIHAEVCFNRVCFNKEPSLIWLYFPNILQTKILTCIIAVQWETNIRLSDWSGKDIFRMSNNRIKYKKVMNRSGKQEREMNGREYTDTSTRF